MKHLFLSIAFFIPLAFSFGQTPSPVEEAEHAVGKIILAAEKDGDFEDSIFLYLKEARAAFLLSQNWQRQLSAALEKAPQLFRLGYATAGTQWLAETDEDVVRAAGEKYDQRPNLTYQMARGYFFQKQFQKCVNLARPNLSQIAPGSADYADHLNLIGAGYRNMGRLTDALEAYEEALSIRKKIFGPFSDEVASVLNNLGVAYKSLGLYDDALATYEEGLAIRKKSLGPRHSTVANFLINLGVLAKEKGEFKKAQSFYYEALDLLSQESDENRKRIADVYANLAIVFQKMGAYQEAESFGQKALQEYGELEKEYFAEIGLVYLGLSNVYFFQKDYERTLMLEKRALRYFSEKLDSLHPDRLMARNNLGITYFHNKDYQTALDIFLELHGQIEQANSDQVRLANLKNDIADVYFAKGQLDKALEYNSAALALQKEFFGEKNSRIAYTLNSLAQIEMKQGNNEEALNHLRQALAANHREFEADNLLELPPVEGFLKYDDYVESLIAIAELIAQKGDVASLRQAKRYFETADAVLLLVRDELVSAEDKIILAQKVFKLSEAAIANQLKLFEITNDKSDLETAFQLSEKNKNNVLAQSIQANQARQFSGIPDSLIEMEDRLKSDINYYKLALADQPDSLQEILFQKKLFRAQQSYRSLVTKMEGEFPVYYQLKYEQSVPRVSAIQFAMPEKTALVTYFTGNTTLYCFVLTKNDFQIHRSAISDDFFDKQVGFRKSITYLDDIFYEDYLALAGDLHETLFPFELNTDIESLVIVPDGNLSKLPFEALLTQNVDQSHSVNFSDLPYLLKDYDIQYELSASLYYQENSLQSAFETQGTGLMAFAPVFAEPQELDLFKSEIRDPTITGSGDNSTRGVTLDGQYVKALPATADEIQSIEKVFREKGETVATYLFQQASEEQLKNSELQKQKYIHIATHGFINEKQPDLSGLMLYPDTTASEDHILYSGEVYGLNLNASLVVLSACETGLGKVASGEGLLGLSRAFRYAGADHLMVSLWKVEDRATANLMAGFYRNHLDREADGFGKALRKAKLDLINSDPYNHPYFWSSFILLGSQ